jgi:beta-lactamase class A
VELPLEEDEEGEDRATMRPTRRADIRIEADGRRIAAQQWGNMQWEQPGQVANLQAAATAPISVPQGYLNRAAAVRQSDNTATNLMVAMLGGPSSVTEFARSVGDDRTWTVRWELELNSAIPGDPRDTTSPRAMSTGFVNMLTGEVLDEAHRAQLEEWMRTIVTGDKRIRAGLPAGWSIADKTGGGDYASTNDIGLAFGPNGERLQLAVMTRTRSDDPKAPLLDALIADVTRVAAPALLV